MFKVKGEMW